MALFLPFSVAVSPDGESAYVAARYGVAVFDRDTATGELTQKAGTAACITEDGTGGACVDGVALDGARSVIVSPDGQSAYAASIEDGAVAVFDRESPALLPTIADLIDSVEGLGLAKGIEGSLLAKLEGAQRNLDNGNPSGACGKLAAFINQVGALSGKKIDEADTDRLIESAEAVREDLGCT